MKTASTEQDEVELDDDLRYTLDDYLVMVAWGEYRHLLVEGESDVRAFRCALAEAQKRGIRFARTVVVDGADQLIKTQLRNRCRVEAAVDRIMPDGAEKLVGFADREFDQFVLSGELRDDFRDHLVRGRLVFSRGHSVENYYFSLDLLQAAAKTVYMPPKFDSIWSRFEAVYDDALRLACAVSLALKDLRKLWAWNSVHWKTLEVGAEAIVLDEDDWSRRLKGPDRMTVMDVNRIMRTFREYREKSSRLSVEDARWLCHGHLGLLVLWSVYARCVFEQTGSDKRPNQIFGSREIAEHALTHQYWSNKFFEATAPAPRPVLELLEPAGAAFA